MTSGAAIPRTREEISRLVDLKLAEHVLGGKADWNRDAHGNNDHHLPVDDVVSSMTTLIAELLGVAVQETAPAHPTVQVDDVAAELGDFADRIDRHGFVNAMGGHARNLRKAVEALNARGDADPWHWCDARRPDEGRRVVILHGDGSGAVLGYWTGEALIDQDGDEGDWREEPGTVWAYLPQGFRLWCETRQDDPFTFPDTKA